MNDRIARNPRINNKESNERSRESTGRRLPNLSMMKDGVKKITSENATDDERG